jgi:hypothetical protein
MNHLPFLSSVRIHSENHAQEPKGVENAGEIMAHAVLRESIP